MSGFEEHEEPLWFSDSGLLNSSDSCQLLSPLGDCSTPDLSNIISLLDTEMSNGPGTVFSSLMDRDDFSELPYDSLGQEVWLELLPPITNYEEPGDNHVIPNAYQSTCAAIENVFNPEANLVLSGVSRSTSVRSRWPNVVWLICACIRFSHVSAASLRVEVPQALKGVMKKKDKYVCEMRIMKKLQKEKKKLNLRKVWLGTYKTEAQAARALDVGKFFFNSKKSKSFYNPNSEVILSKLSFLLAQPLEEMVMNVKKLAKHYGENGSVQNFVL